MKVLYNSCNMCTRVLPDMYTLGPAGVNIRQNTRVHVTIIKYMSI